MKNAKHFNIRFEDLKDSKQAEIIETLIPELQAAAEVEGKEFLAREWHDPKPQCWQEAYVRIYAIERELWQEEVDAGKIITPGFMWETYQERHVEELARAKAEAAFKLTEIADVTM